jgi:hypothetical protein
LVGVIFGRRHERERAFGSLEQRDRTFKWLDSFRERRRCL